MDYENEQAQEVVLEQEEATTEEQVQDQVTLSKADFSKMQRKAIAYDANKNKPKEEITNNSSSLKPIDILRSDEMKLSREGYSETTIEFIMNNGGRKALENKSSMLSLAVKAQQEQERAENASSQVSDASQLSEVERKYTPEQMRNMTTAELKKILPHAD